MTKRSEAKKREAKLRVENKNSRYFDEKLRFALLASFRSAIFSKIQVDNKLIIFPARVKYIETAEYLAKRNLQEPAIQAR